MKLRGVVAGSTLYALVYALLGWDRYATYHSGADLGLFVQTLSTAFERDGFRNTLEGANHFTYHFSPVLYLVAPPLIVFKTPLVLVVVQAVACALVASGLYAVARRRTSERTAFAIAAIGWVYPPLAGVTFTDFHENGLVPAATVWLLWALDANRLKLAALFALCLLAIKEDQGLILAAAGIGTAVAFGIRGHRPRAWFGVAMTLAALAIFALYFTVVRPLA
ncbi:MAG: DUF2079 domain-containing protein, partial [Candidatus Eremiobacteraeota bacterium]|nr:DUF2079 domain-containing protein [Candidatus Eremiobacteraeota bacterium]